MICPGCFATVLQQWGQGANKFSLIAPNTYFYLMNKYLLLTVLSAVLFSCKSKTVSLAVNDDKVDGRDFVGYFQPIKLPYQVTDTLLRRKEAEGTAINNALFARFVPDSVIGKYFGKEGKPRLSAIGKVRVPDNESYLFVKASAAGRKGLFVLCFDKKNKFAASRLALYSDNDPSVTGQAGMDTKYTLSVLHQRKSGGQVLYTRDAYIYNGSGAFQLILTESNEGHSRPAPIYNPIDTLPHKHKYTGDYVQDKRNFISVRDGRDPSRILFFVHFEKDEGQCKGELKGEARFISAFVARFKSNGDPCTIDFSFAPKGVRMRELEGCGSHRDIKCFFEGYFEKKKEPKSSPVKKKSAR